MKITQISFTCSSPSVSACPAEEMPEFAFIGRSNVGKSSLINMLAGMKALAKVSSTPGKTRMINHFLVQSVPAGTTTSASWFLVDLPGYGFARLSKSEREKFPTLIRNYLQKRETLALTFVLIDSRHTPQQIDLEFMNWLGDNGIGFVILFTKTDKLSKNQLQQNIQVYRDILSAGWSELPAMICTSSETKAGREELLETIGRALSECR